MFFRRGTFILAVGLLSITSLVFGYDNIIIHPRLTKAAVMAYNNQATQPLNNEQTNWIVQGAIAELIVPQKEVLVLC